MSMSTGSLSTGPIGTGSTITGSTIGASLQLPLVRLVVALHAIGMTLQLVVAERVRRLAQRIRDDRGQATTEYALVLLAAALVALLLVAWATAGGGAARISRLFNRVIDAVVDRV